MNHISKLRIPQSLVNNIPPPPKRDLRHRVAWHQYHMIRATTLLRQSLTMPPTAPSARKTAMASTPVWYMSLRLKATQQHPIYDTLRTQVNYKPKRRDKHARGLKWARNPATKAHKLSQGPATIDTANALLRLLPHLPPLESHQVRERILSMSTAPPPPLGRTPTAAPGTVTPVHHVWGHPYPPLVDRG